MEESWAVRTNFGRSSNKFRRPNSRGLRQAPLAAVTRGLPLIMASTGSTLNSMVSIESPFMHYSSFLFVGAEAELEAKVRRIA